METLLGKIEVIRNWRYWYYEEILESFSEIISVKLRENSEEILERLWKNIGNTSYKLFKKSSDRNFMIFQYNFWKNYENLPKNFKLFYRKITEKPIKFLEIFGALLKICQDQRFKA